MFQLNFLIGFAAILIAMGLRLSHPAPAPPAIEQDSEEAPATALDSNSPETGSSDLERAEPVSRPTQTAPRLVLPPLPADPFAPGLDEFDGETEARLRQRLAAYQTQGDSTRALLAIERLIERGLDAPELKEQWAEQLESAPLWQPDPKERRSVAFQVSITLPKEAQWSEAKAKQTWQQKMVQMSGGLILPKITIQLTSGATPALKLGANPELAIPLSGGSYQVELTLAKALQQAAALAPRQVTDLNDALTRREWDRLGR